MQQTLQTHWLWRLARRALPGVAFGLLSLSLSFLYFYHVRSALAGQGATTTPQVQTGPFVADLRHDYYMPSGQLARTVQLRYVRYKDGGHVMQQSETYPIRLQLMSEIFDMQNERKIFLEPNTKSRITMPYSQAEQINFRAGVWEETCPTEDLTVLPGDSYLGYRTTHIIKHFGSDMTIERWMIPELDCFSVKEIEVIRGARSERIAVSLKEGDPSGTTQSQLMTTSNDHRLPSRNYIKVPLAMLSYWARN